MPKPISPTNPLYGERTLNDEVTPRRIRCARWPRIEWRDSETGELDRAQGPAVVYDNGSWEWRRDGLLHRADGPAVYLSPGSGAWRDPIARLTWGEHQGATTLWYREGRLSRTDGPAVILETPGQRKPLSTRYYRRGLLHRGGGPALKETRRSGVTVERWYRDGRLSREDGPAVSYSDGREAWCLDGELHRCGGPAVAVPHGVQGWFCLLPLPRPVPGGSALYYENGELVSRSRLEEGS